MHHASFALFLTGVLGNTLSAADEILLVASYDVAHEVYKDLTVNFSAGDPGEMQLSHGGSRKHALFANVPVLDAGGRGATTTFA